MNQDRMEKKILESIQTLEIPGPDPEFEAKVRSQFLNKASHSKRKRNSYKVIKYTSVAAATIFLGSYLYNSNVLELIPSNQKEIVQEYSEKDTKIQTAELSKGMWEKFTLSLADGYQVISAPDQSFSLFVDADHKKLYMVKGDQGLLIHESANDIVNMQLVPFPNQEDRFYVFINELDATSESESRNMTAVLYELHADGSAEFIHDLPQAGYYGDYQVYWSPKGERAFITFENQEGYWVGGIIDPLTYSYQVLYGQVKKTPEEERREGPQLNRWAANWLDESRILFYNAPGQAFYQLHVDEKRAFELKLPLPELSDQGFYVQEIRPANESARYAFIKVGPPQYDASFAGTQRVYLLDVEKERMSELPFPFKRTASSYDQEYITGLPEGNALVSQVLQLKKNHYLLHVGLFDLNHEEYTFDYEVSFDYPVYVDKTILISPSGKQAAMRVIGYTLEGEPQQTLILFDLETVSELLSPLEVGAYYDTFEWKDDHTIIVQGEEISISSVKK